MRSKVLATIVSIVLVSALVLACGSKPACAETVLTKIGSSSSGSSSRSPSPAPRSPSPKPATPKAPTPKAPSATVKPATQGTTKPTVKPTTGATTKVTPAPTKTTTKVTTPPKKVTAHKPGQAAGVKAPTTRTRFSQTYRAPNSRVVFVYHNVGFYSSPLYWSLHRQDFLMDPYFRGGFYGGIHYLPNYLNPLSMWYMHPVMIAQSCRAERVPVQESTEIPESLPNGVVELISIRPLPPQPQSVRRIMQLTSHRPAYTEHIGHGGLKQEELPDDESISA